MKLPNSFITTIQNTFKEDGEKFLAVLPSLIDEASQRWGLTDVRPVTNLSYNFVAFAKRPSTASAPHTCPGGRCQGNGRGSALDEVILKIGVLNPELISEMAALRLFNGEGACRLLESDEERGFLLLERLQPGTMLSELEDDDERTHIAVDVMSRLWREVPSASSAQAAVIGGGDAALSNEKFIKLSDWFEGLKKIRPLFNGGTGPFPKKLLERVESFLPELFADKNVKLMHGDFHHFNILNSERGWLIIDPKGVIGPVGYEIGPLMLNPWSSISDKINFQARPERSRRIQTERRVSILSERLGWEREKIINWATAHAVLSAWWDTQPDGTGGEYSMWCAEIFSEIK